MELETENTVEELRGGHPNLGLHRILGIPCPAVGLNTGTSEGLVANSVFGQGAMSREGG